uniref:NLP effector protein Pc109174 n=1 Tax=Phytophthora capsici TaxID=4784 RepID=NLP74_PHYCP|nr:Nep1-like protein Pc109174 [Phytophthora capsici]|eukprot:jgi/Phyca11/109174/e_gw1.16.123.1
MNLVPALVLLLALAQTVLGATIGHDKVQPFAQPDPVTVSEKAAVKYKPQLQISDSCVSFPAVNAAGEITGGLKGTKGTDGCTEAPLGSQVYGRSTWYQDKWAMMFAWYFPKNFWGGGAKSRHLWANMVLWIDNPALETPKILGASLSRQTLEVPKAVFLSMGEQQKDPYSKVTAIPPMGFVGMQAIQTSRISRFRYTYNYTGGSDISTRVSQGYPDNSAWISLTFAGTDGEYQDLIMWNQLTDQARAALESADFGEDTKVPFNDKNFEAALAQAWPF